MPEARFRPQLQGIPCSLSALWGYSFFLRGEDAFRLKRELGWATTLVGGSLFRLNRTARRGQCEVQELKKGLAEVSKKK